MITKRVLRINRGSEGPHYDPYSFEELSVETTENGFTNEVTLHLGLAVWIDINGDRLDHDSLNAWGSKYEEGIQDLEALFEHLTGINPDKFHDYYDRIHTRRKCCANPRPEWTNGFPGEHLCICKSCGAFLDSSFSLAEVI